MVKIVCFSMPGTCYGPNRQFQHVWNHYGQNCLFQNAWNMLWSQSSVSACLECVVEKTQCVHTVPLAVIFGSINQGQLE
jgi:hypothetical protein